jgi:hypothetical protein
LTVLAGNSSSNKKFENDDEKDFKSHVVVGPEAGNTKGESITVPLTSCLTGLDSAV